MRTFRQENRYGDRIRSERVRLGFTQAEWARRCGVSKTSQVAYEAGTYKPDIAYLDGAIALGADPSYLLSGRPMAAMAAAEFDWGLAEKLMTIIDAWAATRPAPVPTATRARLLKLLYSQHSMHRELDEQDVQKTLTMVG